MHEPDTAPVERRETWLADGSAPSDALICQRPGESPGRDDAVRAFGYNASLFPAAGTRPADISLRNQANAMQEVNPINHLIKDLSERTDVLRGYL